MRPVAWPRDVELLCSRWAPLRYPILIRGERGTGKTHLARHIHQLSGRAGEFVTASLAEMTSGLELDRMLGHTRGSFTSAVGDHRGVLLRADRGTAFLDELGKASLQAQGALLGFLDHGRITPIGSERDLILNLKLVAATNADLETMVRLGTFLHDLLDRFGYYVIVMKPLRDRRSEILPLAQDLLATEWQRNGRPGVPGLNHEVQRCLLEAPWPGNVRELVKLVEYLAGNAGVEITLGDLPPAFLATLGLQPNDVLEPFSIRARRMLEECGGNKSEAARRLGKSRGHLHRILTAASDY
jgi:psp operon transcriptional activator